jgi:hypothetical protein
MQHALIVVDDFYEDPDALVERVLALPFRREPGVNYPGAMAETFQDVREPFQRFADLLGGIDIKYRGTQGGFRITTEADMANRTSLVHTDSSDYSAVVYLSRHPAQGTYFYRHKGLGIDYLLPEHDHRADIGRAIARDTLNLAAWEVTQVIAMKHNRLIVFDGRYFHSGAQRFEGNGLADGRLTQHFFIHRA